MNRRNGLNWSNGWREFDIGVLGPDSCDVEPGAGRSTTRQKERDPSTFVM
jgi:hypothetical protein